MATYAIGDLQGCFEPLGRLLSRIAFARVRDRLWFVGDRVNRGPDSLECLRFVKRLGDAAVTVLGNHDLHLLALARGRAEWRDGDDGLRPILAARDRDRLLDWLQSRPLLHHDAGLGWTMFHLGLPPQWTIATANECARDLEQALQRGPERLLERMYGDAPDLWSPDLQGPERLRFTVNCLTRLRYVDADGRLALRVKGPPQKYRSAALIPWFEAAHAAWRGPRIVFGHWSTLGFFRNADVIGLDTGCVWGGCLSALRLSPTGDHELIRQVRCAQAQRPGA
jgi:bis(5'-nucleosyl)-tetraphosphatase (symmetrical)